MPDQYQVQAQRVKPLKHVPLGFLLQPGNGKGGGTDSHNITHADEIHTRPGRGRSQQNCQGTGKEKKKLFSPLQARVTNPESNEKIKPDLTTFFEVGGGRETLTANPSSKDEGVSSELVMRTQL